MSAEPMARLHELLQVAESQAELMSRTIDRLTADIDQLQDLVARARYDLQSLAKGVKHKRPPPPDGNRSYPALERFARPVRSVLIRIQPHGRGKVVIDDNACEAFLLSPKLTELAIFAGSGDSDHNGVAGYRSVEEGEHSLLINRHNLSQLTHRLRRRFQRYGWNPFLLETICLNKRLSRFRLKTRGLTVIDAAGQPVIHRAS